MSRTIAFGSEIDAYFDMAAGREFNSVGEKVLEDLLEALGVALHRMRKSLGKLHMEGQVLSLGNMTEAAFNIVAQHGKRYFLDL